MSLVQEETLDPQDWTRLRALGHRMIDDVFTYLQGVRKRPVWRPIPAETKARFQRPLSRAPEDPEQIYEEFREHVLPYPTGNIHPRFWGYVMGTGTPLGMLAELLAAAMNSNASGFEDGPTQVERQVIEWCREMFGFPTGTSGLLVSGCSMANVVGLTVARNARAGFDVRETGLVAAPARPTLYASREVHSSNKKAVELLGLGRESLRLLPVDRHYRLELDALRAAVAADRAAGLRPLCVIGNAGTVNTGASDDLEALADFCAREGLWLHVDGAFGAWAALSPASRTHVRGLERADSLAFDLHKWGSVPYEAGCVLVRDAQAHRAAFAMSAPYLAALRGGLAPRGAALDDYGPQLSRGFRALKVWMALKHHGVDQLGRLVQQNVDQAAYLAELVRRAPELELLAPVPLNVVCFRYRGGAPEEALDELNARLLVRLQESGVVLPTSTRLEGRFALRAAITNHRSRREDFELLVSETVRLGRELERARAAEPAPARATAS